MKKFVLAIAAIVIAIQLQAQSSKIGVKQEGVVINNIGVDVPDQSAVLDVNSSDKGVIFPRLTAEQKSQIANPAEGLLIYNLTTKFYEYFNGTEWLMFGTPQTPPNAPSNLVATAVSSSRIDLSWTDNSNSEIGFLIQRDTDVLFNNPVETQITVNETSYQDTYLMNGIKYYYRVKATGGGSDSEWSNIDSSTTNSQGVETDGINDYIYNADDPINLGNNENGDFSLVFKMKPNYNTGGTAKKQYLHLIGSGNFGVSIFDEYTGTRTQHIQVSQGNVLTEITFVGAGRLDGESHYYHFKKSTHDGLNWRWYTDDTYYDNPAISSSRNFLKENPLLDLEVTGFRWATSWTNSNLWDGILGWYILTKPCLNDAQNSFLKSGGLPNSPESRAIGLGVSGIDTIGVDGITTLVVRWVKCNQLFEKENLFYVKEEVTSDNHYGQLMNFTDPENALVDF